MGNFKEIKRNLPVSNENGQIFSTNIHFNGFMNLSTEFLPTWHQFNGTDSIVRELRSNGG